MKITKLVHSCLHIEERGKKVLVDPGNFSWKSNLATSKYLKNLDAVVVTHGHQDHLSPEFVAAIQSASPAALWYGPKEVVQMLSTLGVRASSESIDTSITFIASEHADLSPWANVQPDHTSYVLFQKVLVGGDCHTLQDMHGATIFAAAINGGPWGSAVGFLKMVQGMKTKPKYVLPLHDWHWREEAKENVYEKLPEALKQFGVTFVPLEDGKTQEIIG